MSMRIIIGFILAISLSTSVQAIVIGDKDWLQVPVTSAYNWNDFNEKFDTTTGQCDTDCLVGGAVDLTGYIWASNTEVNALFKTYTGQEFSLPSTTYQSVSLGTDGAEPFFVDFLATYDFNGGESIRGFTRESSLGDPYGDMMSIVRYDSTAPDLMEFDTNELRSWDSNVVGGWFYKTVQVPEPTTFLLLSLGLVGIGFARRKNSS